MGEEVKLTWGKIEAAVETLNQGDNDASELSDMVEGFLFTELKKQTSDEIKDIKEEVKLRYGFSGLLAERISKIGEDYNLPEEEIKVLANNSFIFNRRVTFMRKGGAHIYEPVLDIEKKFGYSFFVPLHSAQNTITELVHLFSPLLEKGNYILHMSHNYGDGESARKDFAVLESTRDIPEVKDTWNMQIPIPNVHDLSREYTNNGTYNLDLSRGVVSFNLHRLEDETHPQLSDLIVVSTRRARDICALSYNILPKEV